LEIHIAKQRHLCTLISILCFIKYKKEDNIRHHLKQSSPNYFNSGRLLYDLNLNHIIFSIHKYDSTNNTLQDITLESYQVQKTDIHTRTHSLFNDKSVSSLFSSSYSYSEKTRRVLSVYEINITKKDGKEKKPS